MLLPSGTEEGRVQAMCATGQGIWLSAERTDTGDCAAQGLP